MQIIPITAVFFIAAVAVSVLADIKKNEQYKKYPSSPDKKPDVQVDSILWDLEHGQAVNFSDLDGIFAFIEGRYDCSDFRLQSLLRIAYGHNDKLDDATREKVKSALTGFKYWMDEPGGDSMCFWSENHQILFAASEYLAGQLYPDTVFPNNGMTGKEHMAKAEKRILDWLGLRWKYGFTEWYSNVYYVEDIAPMCNLIDFCQNPEIVEKARIILDLLLYDIASQSYKGNFITTSGRLYETNKKSGRNASTRDITRSIWGFETGDERRGMDYHFITVNRYHVPEVIRKIGYDTGTAEIKASNGLGLCELKSEGLSGTGNRQIMMQWGMEAFTNPETITNTMKYVAKSNLLGNESLNDLKAVNFTLLKALGLLPAVSRIINPQSNGMAIQRANTYTYRTPGYCMATAQHYHPGEYGDQQHIWTATLGNELSIFTTHPAVMPGERPPFGESPSYWVGSGRLPDSAQDRNINLTLYILPAKKGMMEKKLLHFTHAYFPEEVFDEVRIEQNYAFGRYGDAYAAFTAKNHLHYADGSTSDLIQDGQETFWICEMGTAGEDGSFDEFIKRIRDNRVTYRDRVLTYTSRGKSYRLEYKGDFLVNGNITDTNYPRIDSPYAHMERKDKAMTLEYNGSGLYLNFENGVRKEW